VGRGRGYGEVDGAGECCRVLGGGTEGGEVCDCGESYGEEDWAV
jgi:hypothetical protein